MTETTRDYDWLDGVLMDLDRALGTALGRPAQASRPYPAEDLPEPALTPAQRRHAAGLMRVDHAGEVAAQALYNAQAVTARSTRVRQAMRQSAVEEVDHLAWCERRLGELNDRTSLLRPFWYLGSFAVGALAGACGDRWSLGFVAETEHQVVRHLDSHLSRLPAADAKSRAVLTQMRKDEGCHATTAVRAGGAPLPGPVARLMTLCARVMTGTAYYI
jgi:ubiquinone biosynthesis monooxygenase Coq7